MKSLAYIFSGLLLTSTMLNAADAEPFANPPAPTNAPAVSAPPPVVATTAKPTPYGYDYFNLRDGLTNSEIVFEKNKKGRVVFLGGSITQMQISGSWHDLVQEYLQKRYPDTAFDFINAGIASLGSTPDSFRFTRDVMKNGPVDLLFVDVAVNDEVNGMTPTEMTRGMEGIIRQARIANPNVDIVMLHFVDYLKLPVINAGKTPVVIDCDEKVADYYGVASLNLAKEVAERERAGEFNWQRDFKGIHPSQFGHGVYGRAIERLLDAAWAAPLPDNAAAKPNKLPDKPLDDKSYYHGRLGDIAQAQLEDGWKLDPKWTPDDKVPTRPGFVNVPALVAEKPGSTLHLKFDGTAIGLFVEAGPDAGVVEYSIDGAPFATKDLFTPWSAGLHIPWAHMLATDLAPGPHELTLKVGSKPNPKSKGTAVHIFYFLEN